MKTLWTPWRIEHVLGKAPQQEGCLFEPPGSASCSKPHLLLYRDRSSLCLLNRFPYTNGHLLVAPNRHVACLTELTEEETGLLMVLIGKATAILRKILHPDGFNIGCNIGRDAGAGIDDHLHFHIVPRWRGDHNFMTPISDIRTIPEHIEQTFDKLVLEFQALYRQNKDGLT